MQVSRLKVKSVALNLFLLWISCHSSPSLSLLIFCQSLLSYLSKGNKKPQKLSKKQNSEQIATVTDLEHVISM